MIHRPCLWAENLSKQVIM